MGYGRTLKSDKYIVLVKLCQVNRMSPCHGDIRYGVALDGALVLPIEWFGLQRGKVMTRGIKSFRTFKAIG